MCRADILQELDFYYEFVGLVPVNAGESRRKAIREGRYKPPPSAIYKRGQTRGQRKLIELQPPVGPVNMFHLFVLVIGAAYCEYIKPAVDDGTDASLAVMAYLRNKAVKAKLLAHVRPINAYAHHMYPTHIPNTYTQCISPPRVGKTTNTPYW